jgi:hypothetical protein
MGDPANRNPLRLVALFGAAVAMMAAALLLRHPAAPAPTQPTRASDAESEACPELRSLDPALTGLPLEELEHRYLATGLLPPFSAKDQLRSMQAATSAYAPEKRACMYKVMLVSSVGTAKGMTQLPGMWGRDRPSAEIAELFRKAPLKSSYTLAQREDLLAQVESTFLPGLKAETPGDVEFWRRMYYGLLLTCEATDSALEQLHAMRPHDCLGIKPRL